MTPPPPAVNRMAVHERAPAKDEHQHGAGGEATDVRPERHAASLPPQGEGAAEDLEEEPVAEHQARRNDDARDEEPKYHQHVNAHARVQDDVSAHHSADRPGSAHHGDGRIGL